MFVLKISYVVGVGGKLYPSVFVQEFQEIIEF
jgi:hypothetical protein